MSATQLKCATLSPQSSTSNAKQSQNPKRSGCTKIPSSQDEQCSAATVPLFFPCFPRQSRWEIVCPPWQIVQDLTNIGPGRTWSSKIS